MNIFKIDSNNKAMLELKEQLDNLSMAELRKRAVSNFDMKLARTDTHEDIVAKILEKVQRSDFAMAGEGTLKPGWARIKMHAVQGQPMVHFCAVNGYACHIPRNIVVDVPIKLLDMLDHAETAGIGKDELGNDAVMTQPVCPYTLIDKVDGPDPRPGIEVTRAKRLAPKYAFCAKYGYWPNDKVMEKYAAGLLRPVPHLVDETEDEEEQS